MSDLKEVTKSKAISIAPIAYTIAYMLAYTIALLSESASTKAAEPIRLFFAHRPPYSISQSGSDPAGFVASRATRAFELANIPFSWEKLQVNRQFAIINENKEQACAVGFEKHPMREPFAKFTNALYISQPMVAITSLKVTEPNGVTLAQLLSRYHILVKENYIQGPKVTEMIQRSPNKYVTTIDSDQMVQMISHGHADFMLISNDEVEYYVKHGILDPRTIRVLELPDVKIRFNRRIMCSKSVDDEIIRKLNKAISTMNVRPTPYEDVSRLP